jgi:lipopolysaccharide transport system permease protein
VFRVTGKGAEDLIEGAANWRIWHLMGTAELRRRYVRSRLGQFWLTLSTGSTVAALGVLWSYLWNMPVAQLLPYFAVSLVVWTFMAAFFTDACSAFVTSGHYYLNQRMTFATAIYALAWRNLIILGHNSIIISVVMLIFGVAIGPTIVLVLPALLLCTIAGIGVAYLVAMISARFRDVAQIIGNLMQVLFFVTPVLWTETQIPPAQHWIVDVNPFALFLALIRAPLLNEELPLSSWGSALLATAVIYAAALPLIGRFRQRIIHWV